MFLLQQSRTNHPQNGFLSDGYEHNLSGNMCLTDLNHYKHSKMMIFEYALTQERIGTVFSGVQPTRFYGASDMTCSSQLTAVHV